MVTIKRQTVQSAETIKMEQRDLGTLQVKVITDQAKVVTETQNHFYKLDFL